MKYKINPIALGMKIASSIHITYRICRRFASPQTYPISATQATRSSKNPSGSWDHFFLTAGLLKNILERSVSLELIVPTANGMVDERNRLNNS